MNATAVAVAELSGCPEARERAAVVGAWVWVTFTSKPSAEVRDFLKAHGYRFNPKRGAWQNPCGRRTRSAPYDPRAKYGMIAVSAVSVLADA